MSVEGKRVFRFTRIRGVSNAWFLLAAAIGLILWAWLGRSEDGSPHLSDPFGVSQFTLGSASCPAKYFDYAFGTIEGTITVYEEWVYVERPDGSARLLGTGEKHSHFGMITMPLETVQCLDAGD